jgi:hypothetical protein
MEDIFISYAVEDQSQIQLLADALTQRGWSIWWDRRIPIGQSYDEVIQNELDAADCVIVVWTQHSVASRWVRSEAERAAKQGKLMPVLMEDVEPPLGLSLLQAANLADWRGEQTHAGFIQLIQQLSARLTPNETKSVDKGLTEGTTPFRRLRRVWLIVALVAVALFTLTALSLTHLPEVEIALRVQTTEVRFASNAEQDLSGLLVLSSLNVAGLRQIHFPRSEDLPGRTVTSQELRGTAVEARLNIALEGMHRQIRVNVQDQVDVKLPKTALATLKFGYPKPLLLEPGRSGVELSLSLSDFPVQLTPAPISVKDIAFYRVEEWVVGQQTIVRKSPTILLANLSIANSAQTDLTLSEGAAIEFAEVFGTIRAIRFLEDRIELDFRGVARGMQLCLEGDCSNLMPTRLEWLINQLRPHL